MLTVISVSIPSIFLINQFRENFEQRSTVMLKSALDVVLRGINDKMLTEDHKNVQQILLDISQNETVDHIRIIDTNGTILFASDLAEVGSNVRKTSPHHVEDIKVDKMSISRLNDQGMYSAIQPINNNLPCQKCHGTNRILGYLDIDTNLTQAENYFYTGSVHIIFLAIVIILTLFVIFYIVFNKLINRPLQNFNEAMNKVKQGNLDVRLPAKITDEIGVLEGHFNGMVSKLRESQNKIEELHFEQLRHADKLVTLGELAAEMAHEINNPAAIIMSRADYLQLESANNTHLKEYDDDLGVILKQIVRVSKITGNILKYSKKLPKNFQEIELIQIINESLIILEPRLRKKNIELIKEFEIEKAPVFGDAVQIEQVLTNLVNNAIDAMKKNGKLVIQVRTNKEQQIQLRITDNGDGIDDHNKENIFSPFFTTKTGNKGTGLGLYIVNNICKNHNAEIKCESKLGLGTTFTITFLGAKI